MGRPGGMWCHSTFASPDQTSTAFEVSSVPLSPTIMPGRPRSATRSTDSRTTRLPGDRGVHHRPQTFARDIVDDVQHPEAPAGGKLVMHEVQPPALVGERPHRPRRPRAHGAPWSLPAPDRQPLLPVEPLRLLAINGDAVPPQQDVQSPVAEPAPLAGQLAEPRPQILVPLATRSVAHARPVGPDHGAGAPLAHPEPSPQPRDRLPPGGRAHHFSDGRSFPIPHCPAWHPPAVA